MPFLLVAFFAGVLTILSPCILPLLPVVVGGSAVREDKKSKRSWRRPLIITASLAVSVVIFSLLLKASTAFLGVPGLIWQLIAGVIIVFFGISMLLPKLWASFASAAGVDRFSSRLSQIALSKPGTSGDVLMGAALGPVFNSCSPTYAVIVAAILPASFVEGVAYLAAYALGLSVTLLIIAYYGHDLVRRLGWAADPNGSFRKIIGLAFVLVGVALILGLDKKFQAYVLENGWYDPIYRLEQRFML